MLCKAEINLPDWSEGQMRDVDAKDDRIQGFLRNGWITPLVRQRVERAAESKPPSSGAKAG